MLKSQWAFFFIHMIDGQFMSIPYLKKKLCGVIQSTLMAFSHVICWAKIAALSPPRPRRAPRRQGHLSCQPTYWIPGHDVVETESRYGWYGCYGFYVLFLKVNRFVQKDVLVGRND
jgi:hypothetical protein